MEHPFIIDPDSSLYCVGAVLQQSFRDPDGQIRLHPIAFESKKLTKTEQCYSAQERAPRGQACAESLAPHRRRQ